MHGIAFDREGRAHRSTEWIKASYLGNLLFFFGLSGQMHELHGGIRGKTEQEAESLHILELGPRATLMAFSQFIYIIGLEFLALSPIPRA